MKIAIGTDHGGINLKAEVIRTLNELGYEYIDFGTFFTEESVDYPDYAIKVAKAVQSGEADKGILMCGTGIGMSIAANKVRGIRCAHVTDEFQAKMTSEHNNANVIAIGGRITKEEAVEGIVKAFLLTKFAAGRHQTRIDKIKQIEDENEK